MTFQVKKTFVSFFWIIKQKRKICKKTGKKLQNFLFLDLFSRTFQVKILYQVFGIIKQKRKNARKLEKIPIFSIESGIRIRIKIKPWIRIRIKAFADPQHCFNGIFSKAQGEPHSLT